jgi:hypothetical protein
MLQRVEKKRAAVSNELAPPCRAWLCELIKPPCLEASGVLLAAVAPSSCVVSDEGARTTPVLQFPAWYRCRRRRVSIRRSHFRVSGRRFIVAGFLRLGGRLVVGSACGQVHSPDEQETEAS